MPAGRFAPSPTGPLHLGSLVAAAGSWLSARQSGARWLVRIEDLDRARVIPGAESEILRSLERYGLLWDGEIVRQSERTSIYEQALDELRTKGRAYDCACSRSDLQPAASAPAAAESVYPGICRDGIPDGRAPRSVRFRVDEGAIRFVDAVHAEVIEDVRRSTGDFVIRRADGLFAYQLAVVVDDAAQNITEVVRGGDLLASTARQIALQQALALPAPAYAHLPLIVNADGSKLGKREGALPLPSLGRSRLLATLRFVLMVLGIPDAEGDAPEEMLQSALPRFDRGRIGRTSVQAVHF